MAFVEPLLHSFSPAATRSAHRLCASLLLILTPAAFEAVICRLSGTRAIRCRDFA